MPCEVVRVRVSCRDPMSLAARPPGSAPDIILDKTQRVRMATLLRAFIDAIKFDKKYIETETIRLISQYNIDLYMIKKYLENNLQMYEEAWNGLDSKTKKSSLESYKPLEFHLEPPPGVPGKFEYDKRNTLYVFLKCLMDQSEGVSNFKDMGEQWIHDISVNINLCIYPILKFMKKEKRLVKWSPDPNEYLHVMTNWPIRGWPDVWDAEPMELGHSFLSLY